MDGAGDKSAVEEGACNHGESWWLDSSSSGDSTELKSTLSKHSKSHSEMSDASKVNNGWLVDNTSVTEYPALHCLIPYQGHTYIGVVS